MHVDVFRRTPLHDEHLALGGRMDRFGDWWRPWHYGDPVAEYWAVREGVSVGDVSTLGKMIVSGPDVVEVLERMYPCHVADIRPGRRATCCCSTNAATSSTTAWSCGRPRRRVRADVHLGGAAFAEAWIRDWIESWDLDVHVLDRTMALAAINVTGPLRRRAAAHGSGLAEPPRFLATRAHRRRRRAVPRAAAVVHR